MSRNIQTPGATPTPPVENQDDQAPPAPARLPSLQKTLAQISWLLRRKRLLI